MIEFSKLDYYNKYLLYFLIQKFLDGKYISDQIDKFCDDYYIVFREIEKSGLTEHEFILFDELHSVTSLFSKFKSDHEKYSGYTNEEDVKNAIFSLVEKLQI